MADVQANHIQLVVGVILMALIHSFVNIGLPVLMQPLLKPFNKVLSYGYLSACITATVVLIIGAIFLLLFIPLSASYSTAAGDLQYFETMKTLLAKGNFFAYQIGMAIWGIGGLMFCYLLFVSRLVPRLFSVWGFLGYLIFIGAPLLSCLVTILGFNYPFRVAYLRFL